MELAELKKQNEEEAAILAAEPAETEVEVVEPEIEPEIDPEPELDADGKPIEKETVEPWMDADGKPYGDVTAKTHITMKDKLKGRVSKRDEEIEQLKAENAALKTPQTKPTELKRPVLEDFPTDPEYDDALEQYEDDRAEDRANRRDLKRRQGDLIAQAKAKIKKGVDEHADRAAKLVEKGGVSEDNYVKADTIVRDAVELAMPGKGDIISNHAITVLGEGSEKVWYNLGVNETNRLKFTSLLREDPLGLKAIAFLARLQEKLINPKKGTTNARTPATVVKGDAAPESAKAKAVKKEYDAAHAKGDLQLGYNTKKAARLAGIDVSNWIKG